MKMFSTRGMAATALAAALLGTAGASAQAAKPLKYVAVMLGAVGAKQLGTATFVQIPGGGVQLTVQVSGLPPGLHGIHIHTEGSCAPTVAAGVTTPFGGAGGHFDPAMTNAHKGPDGGGHAGDLPNLDVDSNGNARLATYISEVTLTPGPKSIAGRSLIIHANTDNYTDTPPNGGSGARIACGTIDSPLD
jgi:Cu-Zn family superoxide dismutase